jgi:hypothetical protein
MQKSNPKYILTFDNVVIFKERAGVISTAPVWVAIIGEYMYTSKTFLSLLKTIIKEWKNDSNLVG